MSKQSLLTGALFSTIAQAVVLVLGYVTHLWIGRVLGPGSYGVYGVVLSIQTIVGLILSIGVPSAVSRFVAQDEEHARSILTESLRIQITLGLIISTATFLLSFVATRILGDAALGPYIRFMSIMLFLQAAYPVYIQYLNGLHLFTKQSLITMTYAVAKLGGAILLLYIFGLNGAFAGFAVGALIAASLGWYLTRHLGGTAYKKLPLKRFLSFAGSYAAILISLQILISLDLFMVKALLKNDILAGYYNAAVTLSRIPYLMLQGLSFILLPGISALTKTAESREGAALFIRDTLRYLIILIIPGVVISAATSKSLVLLFFSSAFLPAAPILTVLMIGLGSIGFYLLLVNIVAGAGRAKVGLSITVGLVLLSGLLGLFLITHHGLIGAAWQTTITGLIGLAVLAVYTFRTFSIPVPVRSILNVVIATIVATVPTYLWKVQPILLPVYYIVLFSIYAGVLWLLGEITAADRGRFKKIIRKA